MSTMHSIRREIPFPGRVLVNLGQNVTPDTLIAETVLQPAEPLHLPVTEMFNIPPNHIQSILQVKVGDLVQSGQVLAAGVYDGQPGELRAPGSGRIDQISSLLGTISLRLEGDPDEAAYRVDVAKELGYPSLLARQYLQVRVGDKVQMGQLLASDPDPENENVVFAPIAGTVEEIDGATVAIQRPFVRTQVHAFLAGTVAEVIPSFGAIVESPMLMYQGIYGLGGECFGPLLLLVDRPNEIAKPSSVSEEDRGKVVVAGALASLEFLKRCRECGIVGVIAGGAHNMDLVELLGAEIAPGMNTEQLGLTLFLSEGMGSIFMERALFRALRRSEGETVSLNGLTQIRAGAIRPCVYLPPQAEEVAAEGEQEQIIAIGSTVRIIREPWFGEIGIVRAFGEPELLPSGIKVLIYEVQTEQGDLLRLARSNVELYSR